MKIGLFASFGIGGADKATYYLAKGLKELGHEVKIFYSQRSFPGPCWQWDAGMEILSRHDMYVGHHEMYEITDASQFNDYDIEILNVHRSGEDIGLIPNLEKTNLNIPVVETNFHGVLLTNPDFRIFPTQTLVDFKQVVCDHVIIPNPISDNFHSGNLRKELNIPDDAIVFGKISRPSNDIFTPMPYLAYKIIEKKYDDKVYFLQVGMNNATHDIVNKMNFKNFIYLNQSLDEDFISRFYNTFDIYCHGNSLGETFGNTIAEAMMHGKPIVSHLGAEMWPQAHREIIGDDTYIVMQRDVYGYELYANLMEKLLTDKTEYDRYSKYCLERAQNNFLYTKVSQRYAEFFEKVLEKK
jgi:glycosyltransferase involved in cell wall biosynthesis